MRLLRRARDTFNSARNQLRAARRNRALAASIDPAEVAHLVPTHALKHRWYGSSYGGFYVAPALVPAGAVVYSIGIGKDITFDRAMLRHHRCHIHAFDPTPKAIHYLEDKVPASDFAFYAYGITAGRSGSQTFYLPRDVNATSGSLVATDEMDPGRAIEVEMRTFGDITQALGHRHVDVLKMDIEGAEYEVIPEILASEVTIGQLLLEFHDRMFDTEVFRSRETVRHLRAAGYEVFAASATYEEVSFVRVGMASAAMSVGAQSSR